MLGNKLKKYREENNLTQVELAKMLGITKVSICGYERGNRTPSVEILLKIIELLQVSPNYLLGYDDFVVADDSIVYGVDITKNDMNIIKEFKNDPVFYNKIVKDPRRMIELTNMAIKN